MFKLRNIKNLQYFEYLKKTITNIRTLNRNLGDVN